MSFYAINILFLESELENTVALVCFSWFKDDGWPMCLVWTIRVMLGLKTYGCTLLIDDSLFAFYGSIEEVSCIDLDAWFVGIYF